MLIPEQVAVELEGRTGDNGDVIEPGTSELARARVEQYFTQLRETLLLQEAAAISAVDTHVRERLCSLRQLQEDLAMWLSQVCRSNFNFNHKTSSILIKYNI